MSVPHENVCLLRNVRLALGATAIFVVVGIVYLLRLVGTIPATERDPLSPYIWIASTVFVLSLLRLSVCFAERVIIGLLLVDVLWKCLLVLGGRRFGDTNRYQHVAAVAIFFLCAAISGFAALRGLGRHTGVAKAKPQSP
jgi:hypothetical protein